MSAFTQAALISAILVGGSAACTPEPLGDSSREPTLAESAADPRTQSSIGGLFPPASACRVLAPNELPNGDKPGEPSLSGTHREFLHSWGRGGSQVTIGRGQEVLEHVGSDIGFPRTGGEPVVGPDGIRRWLIAVGDPPLGQITYDYLVDDCPYVLWTEPGLTWTDALEYASRLATRPALP